MESYEEKMRRVRGEYRAAHDRFQTRLREASDAEVHRPRSDGGWSAAQIGWHVAAVDSSFAAVLTGDVPAAKPIAEGTQARSWPEIAGAMPEKLDAALAALSEERASGFAITHPVIGVVALGQIGEWATAHVIRHNAQAKGVLAEAGAISAP